MDKSEKNDLFKHLLCSPCSVVTKILAHAILKYFSFHFYSNLKNVPTFAEFGLYQSTLILQIVYLSSNTFYLTAFSHLLIYTIYFDCFPAGLPSFSCFIKSVNSWITVMHKSIVAWRGMLDLPLFISFSLCPNFKIVLSQLVTVCYGPLA